MHCKKNALVKFALPKFGKALGSYNLNFDSFEEITEMVVSDWRHILDVLICGMYLLRKASEFIKLNELPSNDT